MCHMVNIIGLGKGGVMQKQKHSTINWRAGGDARASEHGASRRTHAASFLLSLRVFLGGGGVANLDSSGIAPLANMAQPGAARVVGSLPPLESMEILSALQSAVRSGAEAAASPI